VTADRPVRRAGAVMDADCPKATLTNTSATHVLRIAVSPLTRTGTAPFTAATARPLATGFLTRTRSLHISVMKGETVDSAQM
jgi:hypothetical protein